MSHHNVKRETVIALLVICVAGASGIVTISLEHYFIGTVTITETRTINLSSIPFNSSVYLSSDVGSCRGPAGYAPCFGGDLSQAEVFNCAGCGLIAVRMHAACGEFIKSTKQFPNNHLVS